MRSAVVASSASRIRAGFDRQLWSAISKTKHCGQARLHRSESLRTNSRNGTGRQPSGAREESSEGSACHSGAWVVGVDLRAMSTGVAVSSDRRLKPSDDAIWVAHIFDQPPQSVGQHGVTGHPQISQRKVTQINESRFEVPAWDAAVN